MPVLIPLSAFLQTLTGEETGIYFIDSTIIKVCHIKREKQHKVFKPIKISVYKNHKSLG